MQYSIKQTIKQKRYDSISGKFNIHDIGRIVDFCPRHFRAIFISHTESLRNMIDQASIEAAFENVIFMRDKTLAHSDTNSPITHERK